MQASVVTVTNWLYSSIALIASACDVIIQTRYIEIIIDIHHVAMHS